MITIISCVWNRPEKLKSFLQKLTKQTNQNFCLYLINNNKNLKDFVNNTLLNTHYIFDLTCIHNEINSGPFSRIQLMTQIKNEHDYFLFIDDDAIFDETLIEQWERQLEPNKIKGWNGFNFTGNYWQRVTVAAYDTCEYLWGSNLLIPAKLITQDMLHLPEIYWHCDDLWLCMYGKYKLNIELQKAYIQNFAIDVDGKDTYLTLHNLKIEAYNWMKTELQKKD